MGRSRKATEAEEARICLACLLPECVQQRPECGLVRACVLAESQPRSGPARVLALRAQGHTQAQIALELKVSLKTIQSFFRRERERAVAAPQS